MEPSGYAQSYPVVTPFGEPTELVELHISCNNLKDLDIISKSDPGKADSWEFIGNTETVENNLNPEFVKSFEIPFYFERNQKAKFEVYDIDTASKELIGTMETSLAKVMGSKSQTLFANIQNKSGKNAGGITIKLDKISQSNDMIYFSSRASKLPSKVKMGIFGYDKPFYFIEYERTPDSNDFVRVIQSEPIKGTNSPNWGKAKYPAKKLCNGQIDTRIKFKVYRWSEKGHHKPYGEFYTSLRKLINGESEYELCVMDTYEKIPKARFYFDDLYIEKRPSFYDFLRSGWQMSLTVAVDFTGSNGDPADYSSLHYRNPSGQLNQYETALTNVGSILVNYDSDQLIPAFGFGGVPGYFGTGEVSHCFHLNGQENPQCIGVKGLVEAYKFSLANVGLSGPTYFSPLLGVFNDFVTKNLSSAIYNIIMILTDGDIHDT